MLRIFIKTQILRYALILAIALVFAAARTSYGQADPPTQPFAQGQVLPQQQRPNLLRDLGLSPEQVLAIRRMNQARRPIMEAATERLRNANRLLDEAIYADNLDENLVNERIREVQSAQAEISRLRFEAELGLRKILTPEQLIKFREIRRRFAPQNRPQPGENPPPAETRNNQQRPLQRLRQIPRQKP